MVKCRRIFCQIAVKKMGYSGADVARFLGITTSAVNRLAAPKVLSDTEKLLSCFGTNVPIYVPIYVFHLIHRDSFDHMRLFLLTLNVCIVIILEAVLHSRCAEKDCWN